MKNGMRFEDTVRTKISLELTEAQNVALKRVLDDHSPDKHPAALLVSIAATHAGMKNKNKSLYIPDKMRDSVHTWIEPHEKPVLLHHDKKSDPIGRVKNAEYIDLPITDDISKPRGYISVLTKITDEEAIKKVMDERYLTVSIGGTTNEVNCSICDKNIADSGICEHKKGKVYDGKECYWKIGSMIYNELSFVNAPADEYAQVEHIETIDMVDAVVSMDEEDMEIISQSTDSQEDKETDMAKNIIDFEAIMTYEYTEDEITLLEGELSELFDALLGDAKISTAQRKKLSSGTFCGPNRSFPVPDCAHVTAARRLIGRAKGVSADGRKRILACVANKAKNLGCGTKKDEAETPELLVSDIFDMWMSDLEAFAEIEENYADTHTVSAEKAEAHRLEQQEVKDQLANTKATLEGYVKDSGEMETKSKAQEESITELTAERDRLLEENAKLLEAKHNSMAERLVDMRVALGKPDVRDLIAESNSDKRKEIRSEKVEEFAKRDVESLKNSIDDLELEVRDIKSPTREIDTNGLTRPDAVNGEGRGHGMGGRRITPQDRVRSTLGARATKGSQ